MAVDGGAVLGGGEGEQGLLEDRAVQGGDGEPAVGLAVAVVDHLQRCRGGGVGFLACEDGGFVGVAGGGVEDVEESFAQDAEGFGVVGVGLVEQEPLAVGGDGGVDVVG